MCVLIVGAGPTGLTLAIELAKQGIDFRIIDQNMGPGQDPKALIMQSRTLELFETMNLHEKFLEQSLLVREISLHKKNLTFSLTNSTTDYPFILVLPRSKIEEILLEELRKWGKEVEWGHQLTNRHTIVKDHSFEKAPYDWLIASDGAHSTVRALHHIPFISSFPETFFLADICTKELSHNQIHYMKDALFIPLPGTSHFRMITPVTESFDQERFLQKKINDLSNIFSIDSVQWHSFFPVQPRVATQFQKNKIFLLGDAAHIHAPLGLNTSIQDAFNLSWKLGYSIKKKSPHFLLGSFEKERLPHAKTLVNWTSWIINLYHSSPSLLFFLIKMLYPKFHQKFTSTLLGLSLNYRKSPLSHKTKLKGIKPGDRIQNCPVGNTTLYALLGKKKYLLLISSPKLKFLKPFTHDTLICHPLHQEAFLQKNGIGPKEFLLIRPDGYLAMRGHFSEQKKLEDYLTKIFLPSLQKKKS